MTDESRKPRLSDLTAHLYGQMSRLSADTLKGADLEQEVKRASAMAGVADQIIAAADLQIRAAALYAKHKEVRPMLDDIGTSQPARLTATPPERGAR